MNMILTQMESSTKFVADNSTHVKINYLKLDEFINTINIADQKHWLESNPFGILDLPIEDIAHLLLVLHSVDFCFFGEPKWTVTTYDQILDGFNALLYLLVERFKMRSDILTVGELQTMLEGPVTLPLMQTRLKNLDLLNNFYYKNYGFYNEIKHLTTDVTLFNFIVNKFVFFQDDAIYKSTKVPFFKLAQLLTSDLLHAQKIKTGMNISTSSLTGCADYKIPQALRSVGALEFDEKLALVVDNKKILNRYSEMEIEIRANTLVAINYIHSKLSEINLSVTRFDVNDYLWNLSQDKTKMIYPYHRTLTDDY